MGVKLAVKMHTASAGPNGVIHAGSIAWFDKDMAEHLENTAQGTIVREKPKAVAPVVDEGVPEASDDLREITSELSPRLAAEQPRRRRG